jgi:hypothetical protein
MVLTDRQREDLHAGIYEYLVSRGEAFEEAAKGTFFQKRNNGHFVEYHRVFLCFCHNMLVSLSIAIHCTSCVYCCSDPS